MTATITLPRVANHKVAILEELLTGMRNASREMLIDLARGHVNGSGADLERSTAESLAFHPNVSSSDMTSEEIAHSNKLCRRLPELIRESLDVRLADGHGQLCAADDNYELYAAQGLYDGFLYLAATSVYTEDWAWKRSIDDVRNSSLGWALRRSDIYQGLTLTADDAARVIADELGSLEMAYWRRGDQNPLGHTGPTPGYELLADMAFGCIDRAARWAQRDNAGIRNALPLISDLKEMHEQRLLDGRDVMLAGREITKAIGR